MDSFTIYVTLVLIVKIIFIILAVSAVYIKHRQPENKKIIDLLQFWKDRFEFVFKAMMSAMLIYIFNPRTNNIKLINNEAKLLLYLFGFILIITANWETFFKQSTMFIDFKSLFGTKIKPKI